MPAADPSRPTPGVSASPGVAAGSLILRLADEAATARLGQALAPVLGPGDTLLLSGPLGAGKSALARAIIAARLGPSTGDIPSPTYTLVNVYDSCETEIWHADLYRLSDPEELEELGLADQWPRAIVLVEWPEKLGNDRPARRLELVLTPDAQGGRSLTVTPHGGGWGAVSERIGDFA